MKVQELIKIFGEVFNLDYDDVTHYNNPRNQRGYTTLHFSSLDLEDAMRIIISRSFEDNTLRMEIDRRPYNLHPDLNREIIETYDYELFMSKDEKYVTREFKRIKLENALVNGGW